MREKWELKWQEGVGGAQTYAARPRSKEAQGRCWLRETCMRCSSSPNLEEAVNELFCSEQRGSSGAAAPFDGSGSEKSADQGTTGGCVTECEKQTAATRMLLAKV